MKLWYTPVSPFVRKVTMTALETGLDRHIDRLTPSDGLGPQAEIGRANPLGKVPALHADDGRVLFDSRVICEYLDSLHDGPKLFPAPGPSRWQALSICTLADGAMDSGVLRMMESRRSDSEQSEAWIAKQARVCEQALDAIEADVDFLHGDLTIAQITVCCALSWLEFRAFATDWRDTRPGLADWYAGFSARPSAMATEPQG